MPGGNTYGISYRCTERIVEHSFAHDRQFLKDTHYDVSYQMPRERQKEANIILSTSVQNWCSRLPKRDLELSLEGEGVKTRWMP